MKIKDQFCLSPHFLPAIVLYRTQQKLETFTYCQYRVLHLKFLESSVPWEKTSSPLGFNVETSLLGFDVETSSDHKSQKIKLYSVSALKRLLNEKYLIHGRVMATISKFSPQIFETYFSTLRIMDPMRLWIQ